MWKKTFKKLNQVENRRKSIPSNGNNVVEIMAD